MIFWIADDRHLSAIRSYHVALGHRFGRVISPFRVNVGLQSEQEFFDGWLTKNCYEGNGFECRHDFRALCCRQDGSPCTFLKRNLLVGVDANDQHITELSGAGEITDMSDVK